MSTTWPSRARRRVGQERSPAGLPRQYPGDLRARPHQRLRVAGGDHLVCADDRCGVNMVTPTLFRKYPTPADLAGEPSGRGGDRPLDRLLSRTRQRACSAWLRRCSNDSMVKCRRPRRSGDTARCRTQDRQRRSKRGIRPTWPPGRHARAAAVEEIGPQQARRSSEVGARAQRLSATRGSRSVQPPNDPSRASCVRREESAMRRLHPRGHLSVVPTAAPSVT
jgi:hypothetical protein